MIKVSDAFINLPSRDNVTNKGDAGRVLVIGGDVGMCGAAFFAAEAAYRMGCGLVKVYTHPENRIPLQTLLPEAVLSFWESGVDTPALDASLKWADAVVIGVGFGMGEWQKRILKKVISNASCPIVFDADALNIISQHKSLLSHLPSDSVITPHVLELARLTGESVEDIKKDGFGILKKHFEGLDITVALKDSVVSILTNNNEEYISASGDSSLSTGGTGDILAGMIASLIAQKMPSCVSAVTSAYLHGKAGTLAGNRLGVRSVIARDVLSALSDTIKEY